MDKEAGTLMFVGEALGTRECGFLVPPGSR